MINGAKWWKFDFHTHTPASHDYGKGPNQSTLKHLSPKEWLLEHMRKEIDCVAVTDHNSGTWIDLLTNTLQGMNSTNTPGFREIHLFPGVEISVLGGVHLLAIFDKGTTSDKIARILGAVGYHGELGNTDEVTTRPFNEVVAKIAEEGGLAIPAHVDQDSGLFKEFTGITLKQSLQCEDLLAIQVCDLASEKPSIYNELKMQLTEVGGSDSHTPDQIGKQYTWVKMEEPNMEALKLALHDGEDGIIHSNKNVSNPNSLSSRYFIKQLEVKNSSKAGRGRDSLIVNFSPWFSTIIGGRGSGKSSILEFLRIVLNKEDELPNLLKEDFNNFKKVSSKRGETGMLLPDTEIKIDLIKDGRDIRLIWCRDEITEFEKDETGNWISLGVSKELGKRFPIRLYSQKQLYELTKNPALLLQLIDNQFNKSGWLQKKLQYEEKWLESRRKIRNLKNKLTRQKEIAFSLKDINAKIKLFEEMGHSNILKQYQESKTIETSLSSIKEKIEKDISLLINHFDNLGEIKLTDNITSNLDSSSLHLLNEALTNWSSYIEEYNNLNNKMLDFKNNFDEILSALPWNEQKIQSYSNYNSLVDKLTEAGTEDPNSYENLIKQKNDLLKELETFTAINEELKTETEYSQQLWQEIETHEKILREQRAQIINNWNEINEDLKITLSELGDSSNAELTLRKILRKEGTSFARDIYEKDDSNQRGIIHELYNNSNVWASRNNLVKSIIKSAFNDEKDYTKKFKEHLNSLYSNSPEDIDKLLIWFPEDLVSLKLKINGKEENIDVGSAGQRTAAMLSLLLSIDDTPLILDQPEDDLDTKRITDLIVKGLRKLKNKQQIIVVTHNPNIPVNGSAEMIVHLNFAGGLIRVNEAGALQNMEVRKAVCDVMEGGSEALSNRYYRIFKALQ